jgi:hypothetical protein
MQNFAAIRLDSIQIYDLKEDSFGKQRAYIKA